MQCGAGAGLPDAGVLEPVSGAALLQPHPRQQLGGQAPPSPLLLQQSQLGEEGRVSGLLHKHTTHYHIFCVLFGSQYPLNLKLLQ